MALYSISYVNGGKTYVILQYATHYPRQGIQETNLGNFAHLSGTIMSKKCGVRFPIPANLGCKLYISICMHTYTHLPTYLPMTFPSTTERPI